MRISSAQNPAAEQGFVLIEILVSALVLLIASAGVVALLQTTTKSQAEQRHSTEAYALAQEDQARLASMRLSVLNRLDEERPVTLNKTTFKVRSRGVFINDKTSTPSCGEGTSSADYVEITSVVTWPGMDASEKAKIVSILSPANGSLDPNNGTVAISVKTPAQAPVPNVYVSGGSGAFSGYTDAAGCAVFTDLPAGNYKATVSGVGPKVINKNGEYTETKEVPVAGGDTKTVTFEFDRPGTIPVNFKYRVGSSGEFRLATADSVIVYNSSLKEATTFGSGGGTREATIAATPLFPFSSTYYLYAGSCASNNPDPYTEGLNPAAVANVAAPAGGEAAPATLQLPALELVVKNGSSKLDGATVTITDKNSKCKDERGRSVVRTYVTNADGMPSNSATGLAEPALPWGSYEICASARISNSNRRKKIGTGSSKDPAISVQSLTSATSKTIDLGSGAENNQTC